MLQSVPRLGHYDAVSRIVWIVAYLDRQIDAKVLDLLLQCGHILRTLIDHPRKAIAIKQYTGCLGPACREIEATVRACILCYDVDTDDAAIDDTTISREQGAPGSLKFVEVDLLSRY